MAHNCPVQGPLNLRPGIRLAWQPDMQRQQYYALQFQEGIRAFTDAESRVSMPYHEQLSRVVREWRQNAP